MVLSDQVYALIEDVVSREIYHFKQLKFVNIPVNHLKRR